MCVCVNVSLCMHICVQVCTPGHICIQKRPLGVLCYRTPCSFEAESVSVSLSLGNQHAATLLTIHSRGNTLAFLLSLAHWKAPHV